jgi:integrase
MKLSRIYNELVNVEWVENKDIEGSVRAANCVLNHFGDHTDIKSIDYGKVMAYITVLKGREYKGSTINRRLSALSKMFTIAKRHDPRIQRPEIPRQKESKPRQRILKAEEIEALINYPWTYLVHRELTVLLIDTGVRPGEIVEGEWSIDEEDGTITLLDTKNGDDRTLTLTPQAMTAALNIKRAGKNLCYSTYWKHFNRAVNDLGLKDQVMPYTMRHSALTKLAENTDNVLLIQKWAGHKNLQTTQRYVKATRKGMDKLAQVLQRN